VQHLAVKAAVTETTDLGRFSAIAAAYSVDRQNEQIRPGAFHDTIESWQKSGKRVPLHWDHRAGAESIIGEVDPASMRETEAGLYVEGTLDIHDSDLARQAWRSVKKNRVGLSFGYMVTADRKGADGIRELLGIDLFEITLTGAPANSDTRVLSAKSIAEREHEAIADAFAQAFSTKPELSDLAIEQLTAYGDELTKASRRGRSGS
jgi:HK97 family phage prohead protease